MSDVIQHFGIKGMRWGIRKSKPKSNKVDDGLISKIRSAREVRKAIKRIEAAEKSGQFDPNKKGPLSKLELKEIKNRKNEMLGEVMVSEAKVDRAVYPKMSIKYKRAYEADDNGETAEKYMREYAQKANKFIKDNPKVLPKGMSISFKEDGFAGDDLSPEPTYKYNDVSISFQWSANRPSDRVLFSPPKKG